MNYADKCLLRSISDRISNEKDLNILFQSGVLNGKNTVSITIDGVEKLFKQYKAAKNYLISL